MVTVCETNQVLVKIESLTTLVIQTDFYNCVSFLCFFSFIINPDLFICRKLFKDIVYLF